MAALRFTSYCLSGLRLTNRQEAHMKKLLIVLVLLCMALSSASCNTLRGMGRDVGAVGDKVRDVAD
jgi:predicted small secreted protein